MKRLLILGAVLLAGDGTWAEDHPAIADSRPVFASSVEMVRLDVAVTREGRPVKGLTAPDFEIRDNGILQEVEVVGHEEEPVHAVLALDNSSSLAGDGLARLKAAAHSLLEVLGPDDAVSLLTFSNRLELRARPGAPREQVHAAIDATEAKRTTSLYDAAFAALTVADRSLGRPVVLIFSDGQDVGSWLLPEQVLRAARTADLVTHAVVSRPEGSDTSFLEELTKATGGEIWKVEQLELEDAFVEALDEFRFRYTLQYAAREEGPEKWHDLDVRVRVAGAKVRVREGYLRTGMAPSDDPRR